MKHKISCQCGTVVLSLQTSSDTHTSHFMLSEGVFASAEIPPTSSVLLWLGVCVWCCLFVQA